MTVAGALANECLWPMRLTSHAGSWLCSDSRPQAAICPHPPHPPCSQASGKWYVMVTESLIQSRPWWLRGNSSPPPTAAGAWGPSSLFLKAAHLGPHPTRKVRWFHLKSLTQEHNRLYVLIILQKGERMLVGTVLYSILNLDRVAESGSTMKKGSSLILWFVNLLSLTLSNKSVAAFKKERHII